MRIALGSDHRGFETKTRIAERLSRAGHEVIDKGTTSAESVDYPDYASAVAHAVASGEADRGILICGTGLGMCIAANKVAGVRAAPCHDALTAELSRRHNDANILCLSSDMLGDRVIGHMVDIWLATDFEGGRHARRVEKIKALEHECD
ncbi:MAG: ribose 5-phosphate isomerase B [Pirellulales bacterium]|nr:ribose 5-phosphate isomerase B [Planctomycetales bacterium]